MSKNFRYGFHNCNEQGPQQQKKSKNHISASSAGRQSYEILNSESLSP